MLDRHSIIELNEYDKIDSTIDYITDINTFNKQSNNFMNNIIYDLTKLVETLSSNISVIENTHQRTMIMSVLDNLKKKLSFTYLNYRFNLGKYYNSIKKCLSILPNAENKIEMLFNFIRDVQEITYNDSEISSSDIKPHPDNFNYVFRLIDFSKKEIPLNEMTETHWLIPFYNKSNDKYTLKDKVDRHVNKYTQITHNFSKIRICIMNIIIYFLINKTNYAPDNVKTRLNILYNLVKTKIASLKTTTKPFKQITDKLELTIIDSDFNFTATNNNFTKLKNTYYDKFKLSTNPELDKTSDFTPQHNQILNEISDQFQFLKDFSEDDKNKPLAFYSVRYLTREYTTDTNSDIKSPIIFDIKTYNEEYISITNKNNLEQSETIYKYSNKNISIPIPITITKDIEPLQDVLKQIYNLLPTSGTTLDINGVYIEKEKGNILIPDYVSFENLKTESESNPVKKYTKKYTVTISKEQIQSYLDDNVTFYKTPLNKSIVDSLFELRKEQNTDKHNFIKSLKDKFLITFDESYDKFQLQVLLEQFGFADNYKKDKESNDNLDTTYGTIKSISIINANSLQTGGSTTNNTIRMRGGGDELTKYIKMCNDRTAEGIYINAFLKRMREGIAKYVANVTGKKGMPSFFSKCLPLQCNPEFKECLGVDNYQVIASSKNEKTKADYGELVNKVMELLGGPDTPAAKNIIFCVFCVINMSEPPLVKEPPPIHYIDVTKLQQNFQILKNSAIEIFREPTEILQTIQENLIKIFTSPQFKPLETKDASTYSIVKSTIESINEITDRNPPLSPTQTQTPTVLQVPTQLKNYNDNPITLNNQIKLCIDSISNINAATPIGTLLFTDSVAKNFVDVTTCDLKEILTYAGGSATIKFTGGNSLQKTGKRTHKIHHKTLKRNNRATKLN